MMTITKSVIIFLTLWIGSVSLVNCACVNRSEPVSNDHSGSLAPSSLHSDSFQSARLTRDPSETIHSWNMGDDEDEYDDSVTGYEDTEGSGTDPPDESSGTPPNSSKVTPTGGSINGGDSNDIRHHFDSPPNLHHRPHHNKPNSNGTTTDGVAMLLPVKVFLLISLLSCILIC